MNNVEKEMFFNIKKEEIVNLKEQLKEIRKYCLKFNVIKNLKLGAIIIQGIFPYILCASVVTNSYILAYDKFYNNNTISYLYLDNNTIDMVDEYFSYNNPLMIPYFITLTGSSYCLSLLRKKHSSFDFTDSFIRTINEKPNENYQELKQRIKLRENNYDMLKG